MLSVKLLMVLSLPYILDIKDTNSYITKDQSGEMQLEGSHSDMMPYSMCTWKKLMIQECRTS